MHTYVLSLINFIDTHTYKTEFYVYLGTYAPKFYMHTATYIHICTCTPETLLRTPEENPYLFTLQLWVTPVHKRLDVNTNIRTSHLIYTYTETHTFKHMHTHTCIHIIIIQRDRQPYIQTTVIYIHVRPHTYFSTHMHIYTYPLF